MGCVVVKIRALSLTQPYASLVALGAKRIETRSWPTSYRGPLAIHASKGFPREYQALCLEEPFRSALAPTRQTVRLEVDQKGYVARGACLPLGCIVAVCELVECYRVVYDFATRRALIMDHVGATFDPVSYRRYEQELAFGDYTPGRYMWLLKDVQALEKPIPMKGALRLFNVEIEDPRGDAKHG